MARAVPMYAFGRPRLGPGPGSGPEAAQLTRARAPVSGLYEPSPAGGSPCEPPGGHRRREVARLVGDGGGNGGGGGSGRVGGAIAATDEVERRSRGLPARSRQAGVELLPD
jgi:hypothetical protein